MVKVTLVRPHFFSIWESLACGYIASYLKKQRQSVDINFFDGYFDSFEDTVKGSVDSDIVGFSCTSPQMLPAVALAQGIKEKNPDVHTVFGGHHPSSLPGETLALPQVDTVVVGEGEKAMLDIVEGARRRLICWPYTKDLDELPFPDRKLIRQDRTIALTEKNDGERIASILSGRGCPFHCIFCTGDRDVFGPMVRKRTVNNVLDEIEQIVNDWQIDFLKFADAELNTSLAWLNIFCSEKIHRGLDHLDFGCNIHAANMNLKTLEYMGEAGCREIWVGVESGSPRILKEIHKGITVKQVENVFRWAKTCGIRTRAYFMTGFPSETRQDFEMTLDFAEKLDADVYGMTVLCPFPGTSLYSEKFKDVDWSEADEYGNTFWRTQNFSYKDLKQMQAEFTEKFKDRLCWRQKSE